MSLKILLIMILSALITTGCILNKDWKTASRDSAGIAPDPASTKEALVQVYGADAWGWRGLFAIHTWIAVKRTGDDHYTVYDVVGWRIRSNLPVMRVAQDIPDRYWFGAKPTLLKSHQGAGIDKLIDAIDQAAKDYPWATTYQAFPGPNSNTFIAWIAKKVPELDLQLPFSAIGSGYVQ